MVQVHPRLTLFFAPLAANAKSLELLARIPSTNYSFSTQSVVTDGSYLAPNMNSKGIIFALLTLTNDLEKQYRLDPGVAF
jgi:hypothetical protein